MLNAGTYPYCCGQIYSLKFSNDKYHSGTFHIQSADGDNTHLMFNDFPAGSDVYDIEHQMPIEESANMIILSAATLLFGNDTTFCKENLDLLDKWVVYLKDFGLVPTNQLCTDDFAGHLDKNINLSVKAIVGIRCYSYICEKLGKTSVAAEYKKLAEDYAAKWADMVKGCNPTPLAFDNKDSFSLKYNIAFDKILNFNLFDNALCENEVDEYLKRLNKFGTPLDSRAEYTKSDWLLWAATLTDKKEKTLPLINSIYNFLCESPVRVPFSDWYDTNTAKPMNFQHRSVQGGLFILLLK